MNKLCLQVFKRRLSKLLPAVMQARPSTPQHSHPTRLSRLEPDINFLKHEKHHDKAACTCLHGARALCACCAHACLLSVTEVHLYKVNCQSPAMEQVVFHLVLSDSLGSCLSAGNLHNVGKQSVHQASRDGHCEHHARYQLTHKLVIEAADHQMKQHHLFHGCGSLAPTITQAKSPYMPPPAEQPQTKKPSQQPAPLLTPHVPPLAACAPAAPH